MFIIQTLTNSVHGNGGLANCLADSGHLHSLFRRLCSIGYRKQTHYTIIIDSLILSTGYREPERYTHQLENFSLLLLISVKLGAGCPPDSQKENGYETQLFTYLWNLIPWGHMCGEGGFILQVKKGQLTFSIPGSVLAFCLHFSINHAKNPSMEEMEEA